MSLRTYQAKRNFNRTTEPEGRGAKASKRSASGRWKYVIQKHDATRLHYDLRLEIDGVLKSWAVPKGPSLDPKDRVLAVEVEDHPLEYGKFEGTIPKGQYGGGTVLLWDTGTWKLAEGDDSAAAHKAGKIKFTLKGKKLNGAWTLVRMARRGRDAKNNWLLIKDRDEYAKASGMYDIRVEEPLSVKSGRDLDEIAGGAKSSRKKATQTVTLPARQSQRKAAADGSPIDGAVRTPQPRTLSPQLATLADEVPNGDEWLHEVKFDGYRMLAFVERGKVRLVTRNAIDWTHRFPAIARAVESLGIENAILDGEIVAVDAKGLSHFQLLQTALKNPGTTPLVYFLFDLPWLGSWDLTKSRLIDRQALLKSLLDNTAATHLVRFSDHIEGHGEAVLKNACRLHLEGIISKRVDSPYQFRRSTDWLKVKCGSRQEFVIGGYTDPKNSREGFGSLLLGVFRSDGRLRYTGKVGSGFDVAGLNSLIARLRSLERRTAPFDPPPTRAEARGAHWVKPELVAEVSFTQWTRDGRLRHPVFLGLREDKESIDVKRERPRHQPVVRKRAKLADDEASVLGVRISHPDRVVYSELGVTKLEVAQYYAAMADHIMPHIKDRPLSVVRCPDGPEGQCFFQKHMEIGALKGLRTIPIEESKGVREYIIVAKPVGLISLVQMNCLELHAWGSRGSDPDAADRLVFDLDPGEDVAWSGLVTMARLVRRELQAHGLESFVMTSGGKGLHVVAPLSHRVAWDVAKPFAKSVAERLAADHPEKATATLAKAARAGKVFIDYLRNGRGATSVVPYSTRARAAAGVSMPVRWEDVARVRPERFTIKTVPRVLEKRSADPWERFFGVKQRLRFGMRERSDRRR